VAVLTRRRQVPLARYIGPAGWDSSLLFTPLAVHLDILKSCCKCDLVLSRNSCPRAETKDSLLPQHRRTKALEIPTHIDLAIGAAHRLYASWVGKSQHFWVALKYPGREAMRKLAEGDVVTGLGRLKIAAPTPCDVCDRAKQPRTSFPRSMSKASEPLQLVPCDTMEPFPVRGLQGEAYVVAALDDFSGFTETIQIRSKTEAAGALVSLLARWEAQAEKRVKVLRTDGGTEYMGNLASFCERKGIVRQLSVAYAPEQNDRAERLNRTLLEKLRALMFQHRIPKAVWSEAIRTAAYLRNVTPQAAKKASPYEMFYGKKPDVAHLRVYGCKVSVHVREGARDKPVSEECAMVGYAQNSKAYRLMTLGHNGQFVVIDAISAKFYENERPSFLEGYSDEAAQDAPYVYGVGALGSAADAAYVATNSAASTAEDEGDVVSEHDDQEAADEGREVDAGSGVGADDDPHASSVEEGAVAD
jgi:transposase InsO family protein